MKLKPSLAAVIILIFSGCSNPWMAEFLISVDVTGVSLNKKSVSIAESCTETLTASVQPSDAANKNVKWSSDNTSAATVNSSGTVTAVAVGTAVITVTTEDGGYTDTCTVTVTPFIHVTGVSLNQNTLNLNAGETSVTLIAVIQPSNATNKNVTWNSNNTAVATVNNGAVRAVGAGTAIITVTTADGSFTDTCTVTVTVPFIPVTNITGVPTAAVAGTPLTLTGTVVPVNAANKTITWSVSNAGTTGATLSGGNILNTTAAGTVIVTATIADGTAVGTSYTQNFSITVTTAPVLVTGVTLDSNTMNLTVGGAAETLTATITPANATNQNVTWLSSNPAVATVSPTGNPATITAVSAGTATITVTTVDGSRTATCTVTVVYAPLTGSVTITGNAVAGQTLTANTTALGGSGTISYQWQKDSADISGATASTYTLQTADVGSVITVIVTRAQNSGSITSASTAAVVYAPLTGSVTITGNAVAGQTLTANTTALGGSGTISYQWQKDSADISGATASTYILQAADVGSVITLIVTRAENTGSVTSAPTTVVTAASVSVESVSLNTSTLTLTVGGAAGTLTATVAPTDATNQNVTWSSSATNVATVNNGTVTAVSAGTATITVTTVDGSYTATCTVTVQQPLTFNITFAQITDETLNVTVPGQLSRSAGNQIIITLTNPTGYTNINWTITGAAGNGTTGTGATFTLDAANPAYNGAGIHFLTLRLEKDGVPYNKTITFTVVQ